MRRYPDTCAKVTRGWGGGWSGELLDLVGMKHRVFGLFYLVDLEMLYVERLVEHDHVENGVPEGIEWRADP